SDRCNFVVNLVVNLYFQIQSTAIFAVSLLLFGIRVLFGIWVWTAAIFTVLLLLFG
ncbi:16156_t:CDS:2, partial [Funneliformis geosporum]